ncbi:unnamed protein product [Closterium sp. NIES-65]|nr:unnamed protein product [Closterium sp. NIES-65]
MPSRRPGMASDALARAAFALAESSHEVVPGGQVPALLRAVAALAEGGAGPERQGRRWRSPMPPSPRLRAHPYRRPPGHPPQQRLSRQRALCVEQRVSNVGTCLALVADVLDQLGAYQIPMQCDAFDDVGPRAVGGSGFNDADLAHVA